MNDEKTENSQPEEHVLVERDGPVEVWTLHRPESRNPLTDTPMLERLLDLVHRAEADDHLGCVVLSGAGPAFSVGGNVKDMPQRIGMFAGDPAEVCRRYRAGIQRLAARLTAFEVPLVAAVNGPAVGAGCDLALMADVRIASTRWAGVPGDPGPAAGRRWSTDRLQGVQSALRSSMAPAGVPPPALTAATWAPCT